MAKALSHLRQEHIVLKHAWRTEYRKWSSFGTSRVVHDVENCAFCELLDTADFYERLYLEKWHEVDDLKGRLEAMTGKRDKLKARAHRLSEALTRIAEESPHFENAPGVCPACMADVALGRSPAGARG